MKQRTDAVEIDYPGYLVEHIEPVNHPDITGELHPDTEAVEMKFKDDARKGLDVVLWTHSKSSRPWVGRVHEVVSEEEFIVHCSFVTGNGIYIYLYVYAYIYICIYIYVYV